MENPATKPMNQLVFAEHRVKRVTVTDCKGNEVQVLQLSVARHQIKPYFHPVIPPHVSPTTAIQHFMQARQALSYSEPRRIFSLLSSLHKRDQIVTQHTHCSKICLPPTTVLPVTPHNLFLYTVHLRLHAQSS